MRLWIIYKMHVNKDNNIFSNYKIRILIKVVILLIFLTIGKNFKKYTKDSSLSLNKLISNNYKQNPEKYYN
jgi:hypothetical protein